ncbi:enoyl-CoA hydratase/isomerase family protein [Haloglomus litoreum]|uniref:enoyl-CoA hydratase/isomerase family protein n=1 Tax=Haloglomus litoreum TaxID=3034026 RepID=UPI0023E8584B|nr:enoyl-CoA hydratase/isomerase family protein [Haloglomus sp. DT116]
MTDPVRVRDDGDVRVVTLDRPDQRNALTGDALDAIRDAVTDPPPVVHIRGAGAAFSAGADLGEVRRVATMVDAAAGDEPMSPDEARDVVGPFVRKGQRTTRAVAESDAVVVAGVDGAARGGGVELALACDIRVATPDATFAEPGVTFGLFGAWGGTARLPDIVGQGDAMDLSVSGRVVDADEALRMGLVQRVVDDPLAVSESLAENDPLAMRLVKERVRDDQPLAAQEERESRAFAQLVSEHAEKLADK